MRRLAILIFSTALISCDSTQEKLYRQLEFSYLSNSALAYDMKSNNDSLIFFLGGSKADRRLEIGTVRDSSLLKIENIKKELISYCGGRDEESFELKNPVEQELLFKFMFEQNKAFELKTSINLIVEFMREFDKEIDPIASDQSEIPEFRASSDTPMKTFEELNFGNTTLIGALNTISLYELRVLQSENTFLMYIVAESN